MNTEALAALQSSLRGRLLTRDDEAFSEASSPWNGIHDARPQGVVRCSGAADVITAVRFARENDLLIAVKSSGHDYAGNSICDGGLVIDLSHMNGVRVDPAARTAHVGPGSTWGAFDHEAQAFGLATTGCTVSTVAVSGFALGGGTGYLARKHGLGLDNIIGVDVVTADGELIHASEREHADLFWGMRGAGANLGVVTSFEFGLHEVGPNVAAGQIVYPFENARDVLRQWRDYMSDAPDALQCYAFIITVPPVDAFPEAYHGKTAVDLVAAFAGPVQEGLRILEPLRRIASPVLDTVSPQRYVDVQRAFDAGTPKGLRWYSRMHYLDRLPDEAIDTILAHTERLPGPFTMVYFEPEGGAISRIDASATAFPHRDAAFGLHIFPGWNEKRDDEHNRAWARETFEAMRPFATGGVYVNLLDADEKDRIPAAYGPNYERLSAIKHKFDPTNVFRSNHNIAPAEER